MSLHLSTRIVQYLHYLLVPLYAAWHCEFDGRALLANQENIQQQDHDEEK